MSVSIWKFPVKVGGQAVEGPEGMEPIAFGVQPGIGLVMWAKVNPDAAHSLVTYPLVVVGTGFLFDDAGWRYVATAQDGPYVWHLFARATP